MTYIWEAEELNKLNYEECDIWYDLDEKLLCKKNMHKIENENLSLNEICNNNEPLINGEENWDNIQKDEVIIVQTTKDIAHCYTVQELRSFRKNEEGLTQHPYINKYTLNVDKILSQWSKERYGVDIKDFDIFKHENSQYFPDYTVSTKMIQLILDHLAKGYTIEDGPYYNDTQMYEEVDLKFPNSEYIINYNLYSDGEIDSLIRDDEG